MARAWRPLASGPFPLRLFQLPRSSGSTAAAASAPVQGGCTSPAFAARIQRDAPLMMCYLEVGQCDCVWRFGVCRSSLIAAPCDCDV